jgi:hypothetical protein
MSFFHSFSKTPILHTKYTFHLSFLTSCQSHTRVTRPFSLTPPAHPQRSTSTAPLSPPGRSPIRSASSSGIIHTCSCAFLPSFLHRNANDGRVCPRMYMHSFNTNMPIPFLFYFLYTRIVRRLFWTDPRLSAEGTCFAGETDDPVEVINRNTRGKQ